MAVTIRQVAKAAGVSVATVSYVLNGDPRITAETRERVMAAVRELDYHPNSMARGLARNQTDIIGLLVPRPRYVSDPFLLEFISGVGDVVADHNLGLLLLPARGQEQEVPQQVLRGGVDGVILLESEPRDPRVEALRKRSIPFVLFGRCLDDTGIAWLDVDNVAGGRAAVEHLRALGHQRIGFISAPLKFMFAQYRRQGFLEGVGPSYDPTLEVEANLTQDGGYSAALKLLTRPDRPTAIVAASDLMALGAMQAAKELGLAVPDGLSIVGFDGTPVAAFADPPLTTVRQPAYDIGARATRMLLGLLRGELAEPGGEIIQPSLVVRKSTGPLF
ncbi:MAG TPA: LacI family DNA-binding transcriptional regulator [Symbiobacteriaceae bacterium]|nr:LacI family DNA-binding transcriptional regulator [Symbiobacteriaceae bacterium]